MILPSFSSPACYTFFLRLLLLLLLFDPSSPFTYISIFSDHQYSSNFALSSSSENGDTTTPRRRGLLLTRITGDSSSYEFPIRPIPITKVWSKDNPFTTAADWGRIDSSNDRLFYIVPRLTYHIDEAAVCALTQHHRRTLLPRYEKGDVLDLCSSWVSHYPVEFPDRFRSIRGLGLNPVELALNDQLTGGYDIFDLNSGEKGSRQPSLPYDDDSFDAITCSCSFDYLVRPVEILAECRRILRPGGTVVLGFSNRCFGSKATRVWRTTGNLNHVELINAYFQYSGGFGPREAYDITAIDGEKKGRDGWLSLLPSFGRRDPIFVVQARTLD